MFGYPIYAVNNSARANINQSINDRNRDKHKIHSEIGYTLVAGFKEYSRIKYIDVSSFE